MAQNQNDLGLLRIEINGSWSITELETFTGSISTLYNIILLTKSQDKLSRLFELYKSEYETYIPYNHLPNNVKDSLRKITTYEIFQYRIEQSLLDKERLMVDRFTMGSPGEMLASGQREAIHSTGHILQYFIERWKPSESTKLDNETKRIENERRRVALETDRVALERARIALERDTNALMRERIDLTKLGTDTTEFNQEKFNGTYGSSGPDVRDLFSHKVSNLDAFKSNGKIGAISIIR